ncbi:MAG: DUF2871 domain-containing protein [Oscillospiraceae bacterium]
MSKKCLNISLIDAIAGMACGVFFREFTKLNGYTGETMLSYAHVHLLALGTFVFVITALFVKNADLSKNRLFKNFMIIYNIGLPLTAVMMVVRGIFQVLGAELSKGLNASISGIAGLAHIILAGGLIHLILALKKCSD